MSVTFKQRDNPSFKRRDSATAYCRKHGINKSDYSQWIHRQPNGSWKVAAPKRKPMESSNASKKPDGAGVGQTCLRCLRAGKTNAEVWAVIQPQFDLPPSRRGYPSWYRRYFTLKDAL